MQPDPISTPDQEVDPNSLDALLVVALDGGDLQRAALILRLALLRNDQDRATDLARLRESGVRPVVAL